MMKNEIEDDADEQAVEKQEAEEEYEALAFDTSEDFTEIFGEKTEFDSWDEFSSCLDTFSKKTGFYFKPRSACTVEYLNEKRINSPIPDRFVYAKVKMICVHFGDPPKGENGVRKGFNYVGKGCEAYFQVSYTKGSLKIGKCHLIHKNHSPRTHEDGAPLRQFRSFVFSEDLDILIAREVLKNNPFELANGEKRWIQAVEILKGEDSRLANLTPRLVKKRIRFLIDKFIAISHGRLPAVEDEMGSILYELDKTKRDRLDNPPKRGRKRKASKLSQNNRSSITDNTDEFDEDVVEEESPEPRGRGRRLRSPSPQRSSSSGELSAFLSYYRRKDEEDRKLRQQELELSKEELAFRKREMEFQKQRFEFEKFERKAHLDLLKAQLLVLEKNTANMKQEVMVKEGDQQPVEYTIVLDGNHQAVMTS